MVTLRVKPGREGEYREWQEGINRVSASFPGFLGTEVVPSRDEDGEWTVIYRFDSKPHLERWLDSPERRQILDRGSDLFAAEQSQQVLLGEGEEDVVTVVVTHRVDPDRVDEFLDWQERVTAAERAFPGFGGAEVFPPVHGLQEGWTTVFRFDTEEHLNDWLESPQRRRLLEESTHFQDFELRRMGGLFGSWFSFGRATAPDAPPRWKTALSVLVGLYPTVVLLTLAINELWEDGELWATLLVGVVVSVIILTWVVMPVVTRALHFWLAPDPHSAGSRLDAIGAATSVAFLTLAAIAFWLMTTQI